MAEVRFRCEKQTKEKFNKLFIQWQADHGQLKSHKDFMDHLLSLHEVGANVPR
jgi:hypothetical protein